MAGAEALQLFSKVTKPSRADSSLKINILLRYLQDDDREIRRIAALVANKYFLNKTDYQESRCLNEVWKHKASKFSSDDLFQTNIIEPLSQNALSFTHLMNSDGGLCSSYARKGYSFN